MLPIIDVAIVVHPKAEGNGAQNDYVEKLRRAAKDQYGVNLEISVIDTGQEQVLSCFVKSRPTTNFVNEFHVQKLSVLGNPQSAAGRYSPVVASVAVWDKASNRAHDVRVAAWCGPEADNRAAEPLLRQNRVVLANLSRREGASDRCRNYSPYEVVGVENGARDGDSTQMTIKMNL
ncbi:MAG TPA: hypothetical protein VKY31_02545 [Terriglobia bacterium]|nr:hypothetical protein [Terriglobia bacterium]